MLKIENIRNTDIKNKYIKIQNLCKYKPVLETAFNELIQDIDESYSVEDLENLLEYFVISLVPCTPEDNNALCFYSALWKTSMDDVKNKLEGANSSFTNFININYISPEVLETFPFTLVQDYISFGNDYVSLIKTDGTVNWESRTNYSLLLARAECFVENASIVWFCQIYGGKIIFTSAFVDESKNLSLENVLDSSVNLREYIVDDCYTKREKVKSFFKHNKNN